MAYQELDYFRFSELLNEEELMVRDQVRAFVDEKMMPGIAEHWEKGTFPTEIIPQMGKLGLLGVTIPEECGGAGMSSTIYGLVCQEIERCDSGIRSFVSVQTSLVMYPIFSYGSEEQKKYWLPKLSSGEAIGCFGLTEPDFGSNPGGMRTKCHQEGDEWVISGQKMWITNGTVADVSLVWARDNEGKIQGFLVEKGCEGFTAPEQMHKWSLRCSVTSELVLENVRVPEANRLPKVRGLKSALGCLTQARYGIAWGAVGAAQACFDEVLHYVKEREIFDKPLAAFQMTQDKLAWMATEITKAQLLAWRLGRMKDEGTMHSHQVSMAKRNNVKVALDIARECRTILGANGITLEYQTGRHVCNLETVLTYEGTHEIHALVIGEAVTGIPAYRS
ncbi:MAG: acyl-CoA dehydrogenase family protein [Planctomycetota bacterium]|jgi:glutaryl-CoA dehydrogenase|nr:acyl-CoA dehydrogenase family protein [Planctomycetota bacterium]